MPVFIIVTRSWIGDDDQTARTLRPTPFNGKTVGDTFKERAPGDASKIGTTGNLFTKARAFFPTLMNLGLASARISAAKRVKMQCVRASSIVRTGRFHNVMTR